MSREPQSSARTRGELTAAEWAIINVVWERGACAAGDVQEALASERQWAYSTVKTTMDRMVKKGILKSRQVRNLQLFEAQITRTQATKGEIRKLLERAFDGAVAPMVNHLVTHENLSTNDLLKLRQMIDDAITDDASGAG